MENFRSAFNEIFPSDINHHNAEKVTNVERWGRKNYSFVATETFHCSLTLRVSYILPD